ncbi:MAG TPA: hypothetical protein VEQ85_08075 [Lacipirellulaceae bacterium]|nr:hypothetical protein [Lacipirellulaceae bacterium]
MDHVSGPRTIRLFFATLIARHVPGMAHRLFDAVDGTEPSAVADDRLLDWLLARHVVSSRRWLVWWGIAIGVATGLTITVHDVITVQSGSEGWILPWRDCRDPLGVQGILMTVLCTIWGGGFGSIASSPVFRRPVLLSGVVGGFLGSCVAYAASNSNDSNWVFAIMTTTVGVLFGLLSSLLIDMSGDRRQGAPTFGGEQSPDTEGFQDAGTATIANRELKF